MRERTADPKFLLQKKIETAKVATKKCPEQMDLPLYSQVTNFSPHHLRYSETAARRTEAGSDRAIRYMNLPGVEIMDPLQLEELIRFLSYNLL